MTSTCPACSGPGPLQPILSVLDFETRELCAQCIDNSAEPISVVLRVAADGGWEDIPDEIKGTVRVFDQGEYVTPELWDQRARARTKAAREAAPSASDIDDAREAHDMAKKIVAVAEPPQARKRPFSIFPRVTWMRA